MLLSNGEYSACAFMIERMHRRMGGWPAALAAVETSIRWDGETVSLSTYRVATLSCSDIRLAGQIERIESFSFVPQSTGIRYWQ